MLNDGGDAGRPGLQSSPRTFGIIPVGLALDPELGKIALRVGMLMACHANKARQCWLSTETMARLLEVDRSAVSRALAELLARGHVTRERRSLPGRGLTSSVYTLANRPAPPPEIPAPETAADLDGENTTPEQKALSEPASQSASLGADFTPAARPVVQNSHQRPRPGGADSAQAGGVNFTPSLGADFTPESVSVISIDDQYHEDEERAHAREASSSPSALGDDFTDEGQALLIFDEMAGRLGWPQARRLTTRERKAMSARLLTAGGLPGWREAMEKAGASNYLRGKRPGLKFFLNEDNFEQLTRRQYDPDFDPAPTGSIARMKNLAEWASDSPTSAGIAAAMARRSASEPGPDPEDVPSPAPAPPPPSVPKYLQDVRMIGKYSAKSAAEMDAMADRWLTQLEAAGIDPSSAREILADEAHRAPRSWSGIEHLESRIGHHVQERER